MCSFNFQLRLPWQLVLTTMWVFTVQAHIPYPCSDSLALTYTLGYSLPTIKEWGLVKEDCFDRLLEYKAWADNIVYCPNQLFCGTNLTLHFLNSFRERLSFIFFGKLIRWCLEYFSVEMLSFMYSLSVMEDTDDGLIFKIHSKGHFFIIYLPISETSYHIFQTFEQDKLLIIWKNYSELTRLQTLKNNHVNFATVWDSAKEHVKDIRSTWIFTNCIAPNIPVIVTSVCHILNKFWRF